MMLLIRSFEERVSSLAMGGSVPGLVHASAGQEAVSAGVCMALNREDYIASHHRGHGHCLAKGSDPKILLAEILGRVDGSGRGRGGSLHFFDPAVGNLGTNGIVGGGIPLAAGAALSAKNRNSGQVAVCFFGDGALNQGLVHECMNMAGIWSLPVIFVCENNGYGEFTAIDDVTAGKDLKKRGEAFDIPSVEADGMDLFSVLDAFTPALDRARSGGGPSFIIFSTYRFSGHHAGDKQDYKDEAEVREWSARDPILRLERHLVDSDILNADAIADIRKAVSEEVAAAVQFARKSELPPVESLEENVFA